VPLFGRFTRCHLCGREKKHQVTLEGVEHKKQRTTQEQQAQSNAKQSLVAAFHGAVP
jgi:hypothetical protein